MPPATMVLDVAAGMECVGGTVLGRRERDRGRGAAHETEHTEEQQ
jgi:hypothetical protein